MLSFVQSWFTAGANPVGVDFGTECLRMAQVEKAAGDCRLIAAASVEIPPGIRNDSSARLQFFSEKLHELWSGGNFRGRRAVLALPASGMCVQHLRLPRMDEESIKKALPWESRDKLPIDPANVLLRHLMAGDIYSDQEPRSEVILLAAERGLVDGMLAAAAKARLDVVGMNVEPLALVDCFLNIYRRKSDAELTNFFVDIGSGASRAVIARGGHIFFARNIPIGGEHLNREVAAELSITPEEARMLRIRLAVPADGHGENAQVIAVTSVADQEPARSASQGFGQHSSNLARDFDRREIRQSFDSFAGEASSGAVERCSAECGSALATLQADQIVRPSIPQTDRARVERAIQIPLAKLIGELSLCQRYHEAIFPDHPVQRLIFVGGEARQRDLCRQIARELGIAAQVGDPLVRMGRTTEVGIESGIDRRQPQPAWAVAIGLSMGSMGGQTT